MTNDVVYGDWDFVLSETPQSRLKTPLCTNGGVVVQPPRAVRDTCTHAHTNARRTPLVLQLLPGDKLLVLGDSVIFLQFQKGHPVQCCTYTVVNEILGDCRVFSQNMYEYNNT